MCRHDLVRLWRQPCQPIRSAQGRFMGSPSGTPPLRPLPCSGMCHLLCLLPTLVKKTMGRRLQQRASLPRWQPMICTFMLLKQIILACQVAPVSLGHCTSPSRLLLHKPRPLKKWCEPTLFPEVMRSFCPAQPMLHMSLAHGEPCRNALQTSCF